MKDKKKIKFLGNNIEIYFMILEIGKDFLKKVNKVLSIKKKIN